MLEDALVKDWMTSPVITTTAHERITHVHQMMKEYGVRRVPVVDDHGRVIGIVTIGDIREASPSDATTLSIWELNYLWGQLIVEKIMTPKPLTIRPDMTLIQAAQIMLDRKVSGLPVLDVNDELVGMLTESDIFRFIVKTRDAVAPEQR